MTQVTLNMTQNVVNQMYANGGEGFVTQVSDFVDQFFRVEYGFQAAHYYYSYISLAGSTLRLDYSDGAFTRYYGVVFANPNASSGTASATSIEQYWPSTLRITAAGQFNYQYQSDGSFYGTSSTVTGVTVQTLLPSTSAYYNPLTGNLTLTLSGQLYGDASDNFSGTLTSMVSRGEKFIDQSVITGSFQVSGDSAQIGLGVESTQLSGTLTGYEERYKDGSIFKVTTAGHTITGETVLSDLFSDPALFTGNDTLSISLPDLLPEPWHVEAGTGNDTISVQGGGSKVTVDAGDGADRIALGRGSQTVFGGSGTDVVSFGSVSSSSQIVRTGNACTVTDLSASGNGTDTLYNVERLQFLDTNVALDIDGVAGQAYRLYQAAFARTPDAGGVGFWIAAMDTGMSLEDIAAQFIRSTEFKLKYGTAPTNEEFVRGLYVNVLDRVPDQGGYDYWNSVLNPGYVTREQLLVYFSESPENQAKVIGAIQDGFEYTPTVL